jgi:hypothetical protein
LAVPAEAHRRRGRSLTPPAGLCLILEVNDGERLQPSRRHEPRVVCPSGGERRREAKHSFRRTDRLVAYASTPGRPINKRRDRWHQDSPFRTHEAKATKAASEVFRLALVVRLSRFSGPARRRMRFSQCELV